MKIEKFNEKKWIKDAISDKGSLRKSLGKEEGEKLTKTEINKEISELRKKDKDPDKKGIQGLNKKDLKKLRRLNLAKTLKSFKESSETSNYMFFGNLATIKRLVDELLEMDEQVLDKILTEHDWASDHISVATENIEQVFDFLAGYINKSDDMNVDTNNDVKSFNDFKK